MLLAARMAAVPALSDPVAGRAASSLHLAVPSLYLILAPVFTIWDGISLLSLSRLRGFLAGLAGIYLAWRIARFLLRRGRADGERVWLRELWVLGLSTASFILFLLAGALWHRPMLSLAGVAPEDRVIDFHSHTNFSHDVAGTWMGGFDPAANLRWHRRAGFDAVFITDHNVVGHEPGPFAGLRAGSHGLGVASHESRVMSREHAGMAEMPVACPGIEVSAWRAHIVLLGDTVQVDRARYNRSLETLLDLLRSSEADFGSLSVASLPEYRRNHWQRLDTLVGAGLDGFEIVNASPEANELTQPQRDSVISLARSHNRFVVGVSDSHGWGATSMVWNLVQVPPELPASLLCTTVLRQLRLGFPAVRVIERHRLRPDGWWPMALTPLGMLWETWRGMGWELTLSWIAWVWLAGWAGTRVQGAAGFLLRSIGLRVNIASPTPSSSPAPED